MLPERPGGAMRRIGAVAAALFGLVGTAHGGAGRTIEETESWRTAIFWLIFIFLSVMIEKLFHATEHYLEHHKKKGILAAVDKIKEELMLMGFISLMLLACEDQITYFCVPDAVARWITCDSSAEDASCSATDTTWVSGAPCCTLGDYYWDHLYASTIPLGDHRRLENYTEPEPEAAQDMMAEAWSHRRLGSVNRQNSLLRNTCPSQKFTTDYDAYGVAIMPPAAHAFDCPVNGFRSYLPFTETLDPETGHRSGKSGGSEDDMGGFTSSSFMDPQALHHVHTLIFLTACFHVVITVLVMVMATSRIRGWYDWEFYGDAEDGSESVDKLRSPLPIENPVLALVANFCHQFIKTVDAYTYIAIRRFYIVRNNFPWDFEFNHLLMDTQDRDFSELVGIEPWMWLILAGQCLLDGYTNHVFFKTIGTWVSVAVTLTVGTKLVGVYRGVVYGVADKYDTERDGIIDQNDLDRLQGKEGEVDPHELDGIDPAFWKDEPKILLQMLRFSMFQFSVTLGECVFYSWQISHACYFQARGVMIVIILIIILASVCLLGIVIVPLYSLVSTTTHHDHDAKHPDRKPLVKKLATHKAVLKADIILLKVSLGLGSADEEKRTKKEGETGWKAAKRKENELVDIASADPLKQAEIDVKKRMKGTFEWAIHITQLEARIRLAQEELQSVQRLKKSTKEEQAKAVADARAAAAAKNAASNAVAPEPVAPETAAAPEPKTDVEEGEKTALHDADHAASGHDDHGGDHGGEHGGEHGDGHGHGHGHHVPRGRDPAPYALIIVACFILFQMIQGWWKYAAETPGAHWEYEGSNGPEWWGSIKEKYSVCSVGQNGSTWGMQSPIDLNLNRWTDPTSDMLTTDGMNENADETSSVLKLALDPECTTAGACATQGYYFNPTQNHGSVRFDCGTDMTDAKDDTCGYLKWTRPGMCKETHRVESIYDSTKRDSRGRVNSNADDQRNCEAQLTQTTCEAQTTSAWGTADEQACTWATSHVWKGDIPPAATEEVYHLQEFHFHTPAETMVNGNKYAMEMQVLFCTGDCKRDKDVSFYAGDDAEDPDNFAIYSVLFEEGDPDAASAIAVAEMFNYTKRDCPQNRDRFGYRLSQSEEPHGPFDVTGRDDDWSYCERTDEKLRLSDIIALGTTRTLGKFAEAEAKPFYGWMGSLTSPPCTENVQWFLQEEVMTASKESIQKMWFHVHQHPGNSRPQQARNDRKVSFFGADASDAPQAPVDPTVLSGR